MRVLLALDGREEDEEKLEEEEEEVEDVDVLEPVLYSSDAARGFLFCRLAGGALTTSESIWLPSSMALVINLEECAINKAELGLSWLTGSACTVLSC
jgi:hypothetical protein